MHFPRNLLFSKHNMHLLRDCLLLGEKTCALKIHNLKNSSHKVVLKEICDALTSVKGISLMHILNSHAIKK